MRVQVDIAAVSVTVEDDNAVWPPDAVETMVRIAREQAILTYLSADPMPGLLD